MTRISRRELIASLAASGAGALLLAASGCATPASVPASPQTEASKAPTADKASELKASPTTASKSAVTNAPATPAPAASGSSSATSPTAAPAGAAQATSAPAKVSGVADIAVVKGASPADITRAAVEAIGGIGRFVKSGQTVMIKPNICASMEPQFGATTNPDVVAALVKMCLEAGAAKVKVFDHPWFSATTPYATSGIEKAVKDAGGEMMQLTPLKWKKTEFPKAKNLTSQEVFEDVLTADVLINVPIAKTHAMSTLTLGMKNLMGVVKTREVYHSAFGRNLTDLATQIRPTFTLVDAVLVMTRNGPSSRNPSDLEKRDTVIASTDIVAADAYATTLFGMKPDALENVRLGQAEGLGTSDLASLKIAQIQR